MRNLSNDWKQRTLAETCHILAGFGFPERLQGKSSGDFPFYKVGDISETWKRGDIYLTSANHYLDRSEVIEIRARPLPKDTTVFAKIGAAIALNRRAILSVPALVDNNVMGLHPATDDLDPKFLFYFVCTLKLDELSRATSVPSVRKSDIEQIQIPVPPISEQRRIVAEIEKQFTRLDAGVAALRRTQANLKRYRAAVLKAACEGRLVPTEAELVRKKPRVPGSIPQSHIDFESGGMLLKRILTERRKKWGGRGKYKDPVAAAIRDLGALPAGWAWASIDQLSGHITSGSRDWSQFYGKGTATFILAQNVRPMRLDMSERQSVAAPQGDAETDRTRVQKDDILITIVGAKTGDTCRIAAPLAEHHVCQSVALVRPVLAPTARFLELYLASPENGQAIWRRFIYGQGRPHLGFDELRITPVALPSLTEQTRIVAEVERLLSVVEELETVVNANLQRATRLRQAILQRAFSRKLFAARLNAAIE